jgi:hypothetical protein
LILRAKHGLIDQDRRIAPYDLALGQLSARERRAWGERVVRQLEDWFGSIGGTTFEVHAGALYRRAIEPGIVERGGKVTAPLAHLDSHPAADAERREVTVINPLSELQGLCRLIGDAASGADGGSGPSSDNQTASRKAMDPSVGL